MKIQKNSKKKNLQDFEFKHNTLKKKKMQSNVNIRRINIKNL